MKILVVSQCFYPDVYAVNDIVRILVSRGHEVTVLTGLPDYTTSYIPEEYKYGRNRRQELFGAKIIRVPTIARRHGPIWRSLNYLSFAINGSIAAKMIDFGDFDVIYVWEVSPVTMGIPAIALKKKYKKPLFLYCMDIWPECVKAMGFKENTFLYNIIRSISRYVYQRCDHIAVSSKPFFEYLENVDLVDRKRMSYLPQFAQDEMLYGDFAKAPNNHTDFLFIGNIGKAQDMPTLIKAISLLKDRNDVTFHVIGSGSEYDNTVSLAKETGADKIIRFYGSMPFDKTKAYYKKADACVLTLDGSNHIGDTLPGKLQTYMAAGKPVIGALNGAGKEIIEDSKCGLCANAGDYQSLADMLMKYVENKEEYLSCGKNAKNYFKESFTQEKHFAELEKELSNMLARRVGE